MNRSIPAIAMMIALLTAARPADAAVIQVTPGDTILRGDSITVTVTDLAPDAVVRLSAVQTYQGQTYRAWGDFKANGTGTATSADKPIDGTWQRADPAGLFWSGTPVDPAGDGAGNGGDAVRLEAAVDGAVVASRSIRIVDVLPNSLTETPVSEAGLVGHFARPAGGGGNLPVVIALGGSEGGLDVARQLAQRLAARGFAALAVAYFGMDGTPPRLIRVPVETVKTAHDWLARQPGIDMERLGIVGVSKGAELALLAASQYAWIKAVAAVVPSTHVYEGIAFSPQEAGRSSWTIGGTDVPFVPYPQPDTLRAFSLYRTGPHPWLTSVHEKAQAVADTATLQAARIPLDRIAGAVFCAGGYEDTIWASGRMCDQIGRDLRAAGRSDGETVTFLFAGHGLSNGGYHPIAGQMNGRRTLGGEPSFTAAAQIETWSRVTAFLTNRLGDPGR